MTPEQLHLAINHIPLIGCAFAIIPLLAGFFMNKKSLMVTGITMALIAVCTTPIIMETGEEAYERYEEGPIASYLDPQAEAALEIHEHRAEDWSIVMYATGIVAIIGLIIAYKKPKLLRIATLVVTSMCLFSTTAGIWIAKSGGEIRRPDFRNQQTLQNSYDSHEEHDEHDED